MILHDLDIPGPLLVEQQRHDDQRGFFARTFAASEFRARGLEAAVVECSVSFNIASGTLRGMHLQRPPFAEAKLVRCSRGRIWDVAVDVRPGSATFGAWAAVDLDHESGQAMYIPTGFAHGFITLEPETEVFYQCSQPYNPDASTGFRWDDPEVQIEWPINPAVVSERDRNLPSLADLRVLLEGTP